MSSEPPVNSVPPIEPAPAAAPPAAVPPAPPPYSGGGYAPAGYGPSGYAPNYYAVPQLPRGLSIASLVTGIAGVFFSLFYGFGLFPSIAGIITGNLARKRQPHARGMWLAGLICGYIGLGISVLWIVGIILFIVFVVANPAYNTDY